MFLTRRRFLRWLGFGGAAVAAAPALAVVPHIIGAPHPALWLVRTIRRLCALVAAGRRSASKSAPLWRVCSP